MERRKVLICAILSFLLVLSILPFFFPNHNLTASAESSGDISFEPSVIPELEISFVEEFFRFEWRAHRFDLKLSINCMGKNHSLRDFWEATDRLVKWEMLKDKATESMYEFGYMISDIPQDIADNVEFLVWKIEGASFDVSEIEVREIELLEEGYTITRIHLPDNLVLSYEDLWLYDFTVEHPSKTETVVKGVKGKTSWNLDPITYSEPTITVIGGTEGSELDSMDIWNADQAGGWNVFLNHNNTNVQFELNCVIVFGNGTVEGTTWFADEGVQWVFNDGVLSANGGKWMDLTRYSYVRFGVLEDATEKTTSQGCSFISLESTYTSYLTYLSNTLDKNNYFYSCQMTATSKIMYITGKNLRLYNSICTNNVAVNDDTSSDVFNSQITKYGSGIYHPQGSWDRITVTECTYAIYTQYSGTMSNLYARENTYLIRFNAFNNGPLYLVNADSDTWSLSWASGNDEFYRQYTFDLTVTYPNGTGIENANVTVKHYGQGETEDFTELTDSNGQISTKTLSMGFYNQTGADVQYSYNPYHIEVTNVTNYNDYNGNFTLSTETEWIVALTPTEEAFNSTYYLLGGLTMLPFALLIAVWYRRHKKNGNRL